MKGVGRVFKVLCSERWLLKFRKQIFNPPFLGETAGELRSYDDEDNKKFLDEIKSGYIPKELVNKHKNGKLHLEMEDHRDEPYKAPEKPKYIAYSGEGNTLGASTSNSSTSVTVEKDFQLNVKLFEEVGSKKKLLNRKGRVLWFLFPFDQPAFRI